MESCIEMLRHYEGGNFLIRNLLWLSNTLEDEIQSSVKEGFNWIEKPFAKLGIGDDSFMVSDLGTRLVTIYLFIYNRVLGGYPILVIEGLYIKEYRIYAHSIGEFECLKMCTLFSRTIRKLFTHIMNAIINILPRIWWIYHRVPYDLASDKDVKELFWKSCTNLGNVKRDEDIVKSTIESNHPRIKKA